MIYIGLDLSLTGTGLVLIDSTGTIINQYLIKTKSSDQIEERFDKIVWEIDDKILSTYKNNEYKIMMEGLSFGSTGQSMLELAGLHYIVRHSFHIHNVNYKVIPPSKLKKHITGKGNCRKELMLLYVFKKWGVTIEDNNIADAYSLAQLCLYEENKEK